MVRSYKRGRHSQFGRGFVNLPLRPSTNRDGHLSIYPLCIALLNIVTDSPTHFRDFGSQGPVTNYDKVTIHPNPCLHWSRSIWIFIQGQIAWTCTWQNNLGIASIVPAVSLDKTVKFNIFERFRVFIMLAAFNLRLLFLRLKVYLCWNEEYFTIKESNLVWEFNYEGKNFTRASQDFLMDVCPYFGLKRHSLQCHFR